MGSLNGLSGLSGVDGLTGEDVVQQWWDPNNEGLPVVGAYRAIATAGSPWPLAPANYAESLANWANPGINDLVEGNGAVPWAANTGWQFNVAAAQYFNTGLVPANDQSWSMFVQFANNTNQGIVAGCDNGATRIFTIYPNVVAALVRYRNGNFTQAAPQLLTGNLAIVGANGYRNGIFDAGPAAGWGGASALSIWIGGYNPVGGSFTGNIESVAIYSGTLTGPQVLTVATAMAAL
jgi:hypothetical protein